MWSSSSSSSPGGSGSAATGYAGVAAKPDPIPPASVAGQGSPGSASGSVNSMHMGKLPPVTGE